MITLEHFMGSSSSAYAMYFQCMCMEYCLQCDTKVTNEQSVLSVNQIYLSLYLACDNIEKPVF